MTGWKDSNISGGNKISVPSPAHILYAGIYTCRRKLDYYAPMHEHPFFQLIALTRGCLTVIIENNEYHLRAPAMYFIRPFVSHGDVERPLKEIEMIQIKFNACADWAAWMTWMPVQKFHHSRQLRRIAELWGSGNDMARTKSSLELSLLLADMAEDIRYRKNIEQDAGGKAASPSWLDSVLQYAWKSGSANMSVREMAQYAGLQEDAFARSFHEATGFNPKHFLMRVKNEKAKEMLQARGLLCKEVAARLGFKSQEHFTRFFCKFNGVSPAQWSGIYVKSGSRKSAGNAGMDPGSGCFFAEK